MNEKIKAIAEKSRFVFWENEEWGPGPGHIDWSSNYDAEFDTFCNMLIEEIANRTLNTHTDFSSDTIKQVLQNIKDDYA